MGTVGNTGWNTSYIFGVDNESGWGERYFFSYFSEFGERSNAVIMVEVTVFVVTLLLSVVANVAIGICVFKFPDMRTVTNCFVLNLSGADVIFSLSIPAVAYTRMTESWELGNVTCKIVPYSQFVSGIVLLWTLTLISMDRHRCIVVPPYRSKLTPQNAMFLAVASWLAAAIVFLPVLFWFREQEGVENRTICTLVFPKSSLINYSMCFTIPVVFLACLLPMLLLVYYYQKIFRKVISTKNSWATPCVLVTSEPPPPGHPRLTGRRQSEMSVSDMLTPWPRKFSTVSLGINGAGNGRHESFSLSHHEEVRLNKHLKVVRVLFLNVVVVLVMWLPITIVILLIFIDGRRDNDDHGYFLRSRHFIAALSVAFINTTLNPLLYGMLNDNFRACLKKLWCSRPKTEEEDDRFDVHRDTTTPSSGKHGGGGHLAGNNRMKKNSLGGVSLSDGPNV